MRIYIYIVFPKQSEILFEPKALTGGLTYGIWDKKENSQRTLVITLTVDQLLG